jgi:hypothetical protein
MLMILAVLAQVGAEPLVVPAPADTNIANEIPSAPPTLGRIIIYRPSAMFGFGVACPVRYKGREVVELGRGKFSEWQVPVGQYILTNKTASVQAVVAAGDTVYVRCSIKPGFMTGRADLQIVDRESFAEHQAEFERKDVAAGLMDEQR